MHNAPPTRNPFSQPHPERQDGGLEMAVVAALLVTAALALAAPLLGWLS